MENTAPIADIAASTQIRITMVTVIWKGVHRTLCIIYTSFTKALLYFVTINYERLTGDLMMTSKTGRIILITLGTLSIFALLLWFVTRFSMNGFNYPFRSGMMGGFGFMHPFSFFGMAFMWLIPIGIVVLLVLGIMSLFNGTKKTDHQHVDTNTPAQVCQNCGKNVQKDWNTCPYCGEKI